MKIEILRGKEHIGGNIIKVTEGESAILLDCGAVLPQLGQPKEDDAFDMRSIGSVQAAFLSHHHGDHVGLIEKLSCETALYASDETLAQMDMLDAYLDRPLRTQAHSTYRLTENVPVKVGALSVTAFHAEHSAEGAAMFLVEGGGRRVLYSGDFKSVPAHCPEEVDLLITEGTMLTRTASEQEYADEPAVERALRRVMRETKGRVFVLQSSANLPRVRSVLSACGDASPCEEGARASRKASRPIMQDVFMKYALEQMGHKELAARYAFVWNRFDADSDRSYDRIAKRYLSNYEAVTYRKIAALDTAVVFLRPTMHDMLGQLIDEGMDVSRDRLVFSMWRGYEKEPQTAKLLKLFRENGCPCVYIHTSGHADMETLRAFIGRVKPHKLMCIHSEDADAITAVSGSTEVVAGSSITL